MVGYRNIMNTMCYVHLSELIYKQEKDDYIYRVARTINEATKLMEAGFEHVCDVEGVKIFRKRKWE